MGLARNPFAAARFAPGVIPWLATSGDDLDALAARALVPGARHQVLGPHGSGKSTLLVHLERRALGSELACVRFRGSHGTPWVAIARLAGARGGLVLLDEAEELAAPALALLAHASRWGLAFVASTHRDLGLPTLLRTHIDAGLAARVVEHVAPDRAPPADLDARLARHGGNLREVLFELYDEAEHDGRRESGAHAIPDARRNGGGGPA